jgi:hypothetical protein
MDLPSASHIEVLRDRHAHIQGSIERQGLRLILRDRQGHLVGSFDGVITRDRQGHILGYGNLLGTLLSAPRR